MELLGWLVGIAFTLIWIITLVKLSEEDEDNSGAIIMLFVFPIICIFFFVGMLLGNKDSNKDSEKEYDDYDDFNSHH